MGIRAAVVDRDGDTDDRSVSAQADYRMNGPWTLSGELRYVSEDPDGESSRNATLAGAGVDYALAPGTSLYSTVQTAVSRDSDYDANNLYTLGLKARVGKRVTLNAEGSTGNRGEAMQLGADYKVGSDYSMYTSYTLSTDRTRTVARVSPYSGSAARWVTACACLPRNSSAVVMNKTVSVPCTDWITPRPGNGPCPPCCKAVIRMMTMMAWNAMP